MNGRAETTIRLLRIVFAEAWTPGAASLSCGAYAIATSRVSALELGSRTLKTMRNAQDVETGSPDKHQKSTLQASDRKLSLFFP